ncbi:MAG: drug:proton antiporter, partial [Flavobacteriales bacterium]
MEWTLAPFHALRPADIHAVFALRSNVFIVEQRCPYPDVDDLDLDALHLLGSKPDMGLVAYARIIPPTGDEVPHIGRVVVRADHRAHDVRALVDGRWNDRCIRREAQVGLADQR